MPLHQLPDTCSLGPPSTAFYPLDMTPPPPWFAPDHLMADTLPLLCLSDPGCPPPARPLGRAHLTEPLLARCLEAHHGRGRIVGQQRDLQHILHAPDALCVRLGVGH